ncbi:epidermal differentiation-specific protein-like [Stegostoma tigrinum]|uniref:epidermal differentiation-specific protein-like n=1 Tax=Stegostoma tigrinum TaxID=3053191 RepID=UPI0028704296|nr:epidermal differentiation-specific protein-like [Stegostoma tigrinum]
MSEIILFDHEGCTGKREDFSCDTPDLGVKFFSGVARSLKVKGNHWVAYTGKNYSGERKIFGEGEHLKLGPFDQKIGSLKLLNTDLSYPSIDLFEHIDFKGESRNVDERIDNLRTGGFNNLISSHIVKAGVWILYDGMNCQGKHMIALEGERVANYCPLGWNDKVSSLRPLLTSDKEV